MGGRSDDFFKEKEYEEFQNGVACDLAFEILEKDKEIFKKIINCESFSLIGKDLRFTELQAESEQLKIENTELKVQIEEFKSKAQSVVDSEKDLEDRKSYDLRERETHLLMIGAFANLLVTSKLKYQKGTGKINKSEISKDLENEITQLLQQPETQSRSFETLRSKIREPISLITKAE